MFYYVDPENTGRVLGPYAYGEVRIEGVRLVVPDEASVAPPFHLPGATADRPAGDVVSRTVFNAQTSRVDTVWDAAETVPLATVHGGKEVELLQHFDRVYNAGISHDFGNGTPVIVPTDPAAQAHYSTTVAAGTGGSVEVVRSNGTRRTRKANATKFAAMQANVASHVNRSLAAKAAHDTTLDALLAGGEPNRAALEAYDVTADHPEAAWPAVP